MGLSNCKNTVAVCRWGRQQREPEPRMEVPPAAICWSDRTTGYYLSLSAGDEQMEQDRAPNVFFYKYELERATTIDLETVVNMISATTSKSGLKTKAFVFDAA